MNKYFIMFITGAILLSGSCRKDKDDDKDNNNTPAVTTGTVSVGLLHYVSGNTIVYDSIMYANESGNPYSVNRIEYYLSEFTLNGSTTHADKQVFYINSRTSVPTITLPNVPQATYTSVSFNIGLSQAMNVSDTLPNNTANLGMAWPPMMGGGYHFLKLEGQFRNNASDTTIYGYGMHIGTNPCVMRVTVPINLTVSTSGNFGLAMEVSEWFKNPNTYDLSSGGNYSMGNDTLMKKLAENAQSLFVAY